MQYIKMTMAQALVKFLDNQYINIDGQEIKFVEGIFTIFGHGNVIGLGQALDENKGNLKVFQGRNEQGMAHTAISFAKQNNRKKIIACTSSIGPGACNMVTAAATATVNNIPLLLFPADTFSTRQPDPVLQQIEQPNSLSITSNDAFKPVCKYWDRVTRPEQIMSAMINAMRVLTDAENTGAVCVSLCQNVEGEAYEYPETFFEKRVYNIDRRIPTKREINDAKDIIKNSKKPLIIVGGGARYSEAGKEIEEFCEKFNIPFAETQAGKSTCKSSNQYCLGGIGVTGNLAANNIAQEADLIISIGSRLSDFTTGSKSQFKNKNVKFININVSKFHAFKLDAMPIIADAKETIIELKKVLEEINYKSGYLNEIKDAKLEWTKELEKLSNYEYDENFKPIVEARNESSIDEFNKITNSVITQTKAISKIREIIDNDAIIVGASGSLPGCLQRMWQTDCINSYNMEYGYSCMGYEIAGTLGAKLACENQEVYAMVGDGSFQMLHSELVTAIQENAKINILLFDNCGFGCINNLQMSNGIGNLATEFRYRENNELEGNLIPIDYAKIGEGYGLKTYTATTIEELEKALKDAKNETNSTLIDIKVLPKTMTNGYNSWWNIGLASVSKNENVKKCYKELEENRFNARRY